MALMRMTSRSGFPLNEEKAIEEWQEKIFKDRVLYVVEAKQEDGYLRAKSDAACSGLLYKIKFNAKKLPMISWRWKVDKFPKKEKVAGQEGGWLEKDDYAARVYVIFPAWNFWKTKSIEYIWDETLPEGTIKASPYTKNIKLIVVESGRSETDRWVFEERNIYEDYKKVFGKVGSLRVGAIALMTDADNTSSTAEAHYKNIRVGYDNE